MLRLYDPRAAFLFTHQIGNQADDEDKDDRGDEAEGDHHGQAHAWAIGKFHMNEYSIQTFPRLFLTNIFPQRHNRQDQCDRD